MASWMVVEDEPDLYEMLLAMTQMMGVNGQAFSTGEDAIAWVEDVDARRFQGEQPELALLDIRLPGTANGVQVGARLRRSPILGNLLIVMMTAYRMSAREEKELIVQSGADMLLYKPLPNLKTLSKLLKDNVRRRQTRRR